MTDVEEIARGQKPPRIAPGMTALFTPEWGRPFEVFVLEEVEGWFNVRFSDDSTCIVRPSRLAHLEQEQTK